MGLGIKAGVNWKSIALNGGGGGGVPTGIPFVFSVDTRTTVYNSSATNQYKLPIRTNPIDIYVDWGDGTTDIITNVSQPEKLHTYPSEGIFTISIYGDVVGWYEDTGGNGDARKIRNVSQWGGFNFTHARAFSGCRSMSATATDIPIISTTDMTAAFGWRFNGVVDGWDVSGVTNMTNLFSANSQFNQDLSTWDFSNVTNMSGMFKEGSKFNQDVSNWNTSNVTNMTDTFVSAQLFNQSLANWDISKVTTFGGQFAVGWQKSLLSTENYDATLIGWASQTPLTNRSVNFGSSKYTLGGAAEAARNTLINTYGWTITDGGGVFSGLLDVYPNAAAAYSLRYLRELYVGYPVVRVRRASDNAEQDFISTEITDGTLETFCSATNGFVATWYDQSGNNKDLIELTASNQPQIVSNGIVLLENSKPTLFFDGINDKLSIPSSKTYFKFLHDGTNNFLTSVIKLNGANLNNAQLLITTAGAPSSSVTGYTLRYDDRSSLNRNNRLFHLVATGVSAQFAIINPPSNSIPGDNFFPSNSQRLLSVITDANNNTASNRSLMYSNDVLQNLNEATSSPSNSDSTDDFNLCGSNSFGEFSNCNLQEIIIYPTDQSLNRNAIENNINTAYSIY